MGAFGSQLRLGRVAHETSPRPERSSELAGFLSASSCWLVFLPPGSPAAGVLRAPRAHPPSVPGGPRGWAQHFVTLPSVTMGDGACRAHFWLSEEGMLLPGVVPCAQHRPCATGARGSLRSRDLPRGHCPGHPGASSPKQPETKGERPRVK